MTAAAGRRSAPDLLDHGAFTPYVPRLVLRQLALAPDEPVQTLPGTLLFADVSGFTKLSERLARMGQEGAEHLSDAISASFASLLEVAYANGGGLLKFGGDALLVVFEGAEHAVRACRSAVGMRQALQRVGQIEAPGARVNLRMSIGIHSDTLHLFLAGRSHREPIVVGPAASQALRLEQAAAPGQIVVSLATAAHLPPRSLGVATGPGRLLRTAPAGPDAAPAEPHVPIDPERTADVLPVAVRRHIRDGGQAPEHRLVTIAFARFDGTDELIARDGPEAAAAVLDALVTDVQAAADRHEVAFLGSDVDVDGGKLLLCAGAPRAVGDDDERMLLTLREIVERPHGMGVRIGVNRGRVFTGDVGPAYRRTYTAMGDAVNIAARLMGKAGAGEIYATAGVLDRSSTRFACTELPPLQMKGKAQPVHAWAVGPALKRPRGDAEADLVGALVGREEEHRPNRQALAAARSGDGRLVELRGEPGIGKSRLLEALHEEAAGSGWCRRRARRTAPPRRMRRGVSCCSTCSAPTSTARRGSCSGGSSPQWRRTIRSSRRGSRCSRFRSASRCRPPGSRPSSRVRSAALACRRPCSTSCAPASRGRRCSSSSRRITWTPRRLRCSRRWSMRSQTGPGWWSRRGATAPAASKHRAARTCRRWRSSRSRRRTRGTSRRRLTEERPLPPHVVALAAERSAGNPQFLRDLLADAASSSGTLPETIEAAATARIDRLAARDRELVRRASVLGTSFHPRMLADVVDGAPASAEDLLHRLGDVFADDGDGWLKFRIGVLRDAAYAGLPFALRRRLHAVAGAAAGT